MSTSTTEHTHRESRPRRNFLSKRLVTAVLAAALIASAAVTGLLYAVGVAGGSTRTVVVSSGQTSGGLDPGGSLGASSLYRSAAPGVVAVEATGTSSGSNHGFPYTPPGQSIDTGTGLEIDTRGDILTTSHVVAGERQVPERARPDRQRARD